MSNHAKSQAAIEHFRHLMSLPVNDPNRPKLIDAVPYSHTVLAQKAKKFSTPVAFAKAKPARWWEVTNPQPIYPAWAKATTQSIPMPFESGRSVLPGLEQFATDNGIL